MTVPPWFARVTADLDPVLRAGGQMDTALRALPASTNVPKVVMWVSTAATDRTTLLIGGSSPSTAKADHYIATVVEPELDAFVRAGFNGAMVTFGGLFVDDQPLYGSVIPIAHRDLYRYFITQVAQKIRDRGMYFSLETGAGGYSFTNPCTVQNGMDAIQRGAHWLDENCHPDTISNQAEPSSLKGIVFRQLTGVNTPGHPNYIDAARLGTYWQQWGATRTTLSTPTMYEAHSIYCGGCMPSDDISYMNALCAASATNHSGLGVDGCDTHLFPFVNGCLGPNAQPWKSFIRYGQMAAAAGLIFTSTTGVMWPIAATELCGPLPAGQHAVSQYAGYGRGAVENTLQLWKDWMDRVHQAGVMLNMRTVQLGYWSLRTGFADLLPAPSTDYALTDTNSWQVYGQQQDHAANLNIKTASPTLSPLGLKMLSFVHPLTTLPSTAPGTPTGLTSTAQTTTSISLAWTPADTRATSYKLELSSNGGSSYAMIVPTPTGVTRTVTGLTASTSYMFRVSAVNSFGTSAASSVLTVSTAASGILPSITSFTATPDHTASGGTSTLAWVTGSADTLSIDNGIGEVTGTDSVDVTPTVTTSYILTATNTDGSVTATITVTVQPLPVISSFTATPSSSVIGAPVTLAWTQSGADTLSLAPGIGLVTGASLIVSPDADTSYVLTATNAAGVATATASVTVGAVPAGFKVSDIWLKIYDDLKTALRLQAMSPGATPLVFQLAPGQTGNVIEVVDSDGVTKVAWFTAAGVWHPNGGGVSPFHIVFTESGAVALTGDGTIVTAAN